MTYQQKRHKIIQYSVVSSLLALLTACAFQPSYEASLVSPAYPPMVQHCAFLGSVTGISSIPFFPIGETEARYHAQENAARIGATHVVWMDFHNGLEPTVLGRAYRCAVSKGESAHVK